MAKILCAWEFGAGLGHLSRLLPVAERLAAAGHELTLAVPNPDTARNLIERNHAALSSMPVLKGIHWPSPTDPNSRKIPTLVLADVVRLFNFHNLDLLTRMTEGWARILAEVKPDAILADFAPTLRLAANETLPFGMLGNGYTIPPAGRILPPIRPWETEVKPYSRANEAEVWRAISAVRHNRKGPAVDYVADLFNGHESYICTIPEFDPYGPHRSRPTIIPFNIPQIPEAPPVRSRNSAPVFVYMPGNHPQLKVTLAALGKLKVPAEAYITGVEHSKLVEIAPPNVKILEKPARFEDVLWRYRMIIHHAGLATAYAAVLAGTPQVVFPINLEHMITARGLVPMAGSLAEIGAGDKLTPDKVLAMIQTMLVPGKRWDQVEAAATRARARPVIDAIGGVVENFEALIARGVPMKKAA